MGSIAKSRKSFLIDSLLEERQRQLAAASLQQHGDMSSDGDRGEEEEDGRQADENGNDEEDKMPQLMMDALAVVTGASSNGQGNEEDEERERNTSTRSPESLIDQSSPLQFPNLSTPTTNTSTMGGTLQALAASVASSPFFSLFSKFLSNQQQQQQTSSQGEASEANSPPIMPLLQAQQIPQQTQNPIALAQSIEYYNRLRLLSATQQQQHPTNWSSATQNLLAAAAMAAMNQQGKTVPNLGDALAAHSSNTIPSLPSFQPSSSSLTTAPQLASNIHPALRGFLLSQKHANSNSLPAALAALSAAAKRPNGTIAAAKLNKQIVSSDKLKVRTRVGRNSMAESSRPGRVSSASTRSSNIKKYRCDVCDKTFSRSNTLITHKRIHTGEKPFRCEHCNRAFRQPGNLTRHRLTHTTVKPFVCSECGKAFNRASNLHTHTRTHYHLHHSSSNTTETWTLCHHCGKSFSSKSDLKTHSCDPSTSISQLPITTMAE